jgi:putative transposase
LHARIAAIRTDALHKLTTTLARSCEQIVIEDLHVKGMVRNHRLARAISDMGLGTFRRMLTYKAEAYGAQVIVADRWFPSSKMCRVCGVLHDNLTLEDRVFLCEACGHTEERDLHAAKNLQAYPGLQGNEHVCGLLSAGQTAQVPGETRQVEAETMKCAYVRTF